MKSAACGLAVVVPVAAFAIAFEVRAAGDLQCAQDARTDAYGCYSARALRERDGIRASPFYSGGPNGVRNSGFTLHVNCRTRVAHLKDRDGVSFAGGAGNSTPLLDDLVGYMCAAKLPGAKP